MVTHGYVPVNRSDMVSDEEMAAVDRITAEVLDAAPEPSDRPIWEVLDLVRAYPEGLTILEVVRALCWQRGWAWHRVSYLLSAAVTTGLLCLLDSVDGPILRPAGGQV